MLNPVVVAKYMDDLGNILDNLQLKDKPHRIWNCDETGKQFEHQPVRVIAEKGAKNITIMACVNAAGSKMSPMLIVRGKSSKSLNGFNTEVAPSGTKWDYQERGWMTEVIIERWSRDIFLAECASERPQLLILYGHSSHETLAILEMALKENIHVLSLPPHTTHLLQPLDRAVFGPMDAAYNRICSEYLNENQLNLLTKWSFPGLLTQAWECGLSAGNIKSGFRACGIFPFSRTAVPLDSFAPSIPTDVPLPSADAPPSAKEVPLTLPSSSLTIANQSSLSSQDPELLQLMNSDQCELFTADEEGIDTIPASSGICAVFNSAVNELFLPPGINTTRSNHSNVERKTNSSHRLLTSEEIIEEKRDLAFKRNLKEKLKVERLQKKEAKKLKFEAK